MDSSLSEDELQTHIQQQEVVSELGTRALDTEDLDDLMGDVTEAVAETLGTEYSHVLELQPHTARSVSDGASAGRTASSGTRRSR